MIIRRLGKVLNDEHNQTRSASSSAAGLGRIQSGRQTSLKGRKVGKKNLADVQRLFDAVIDKFVSPVVNGAIGTSNMVTAKAITVLNAIPVDVLKQTYFFRRPRIICKTRGDINTQSDWAGCTMFIYIANGLAERVKAQKIAND